MAKPKLNRRQEWRVAKIQEERLKRAQRRVQQVESGVADEAPRPEQTGLLVAHFGATLEVESETGQRYRCVQRQNIDSLVVGDEVVWQALTETTGVIVAVAPRHSLLARPDAFGQIKSLAANVDQILVVAAPVPAYETDLIDQYLVAAEATGIEPLIIFNKVDLLSGQDRAALVSDLALYQRIGYRVLYASTKVAEGLDELLDVLKNRTSVFAGQSGVGKSSLVNALIPDAEVRVGDVSITTRHGRHTTTGSRLYHLPTGGNIIDSPGVREFRLWNMERMALARGFPDFRPFLGQCQFRDCRHLEEPGCALRQAVATEQVSDKRLRSFQRMAIAVEKQREFP